MVLKLMNEIRGGRVVVTRSLSLFAVIFLGSSLRALPF